MSKFPPSAKIVVGEGFKDNLPPCYPSNPKSALLESDYEGHELVRSFSMTASRLVTSVHDYFGDGSFYLLDVPGHAIGHICGLARTTKDSFLLMGADTCHFAGALRPTAAVPLPKSLEPKTWGLDAAFPAPCPSSIHRMPSMRRCRGTINKAMYTASKAPEVPALIHIWPIRVSHHYKHSMQTRTSSYDWHMTLVTSNFTITQSGSIEFSQ
jgi:hypothetical protein